LSGWPARASVSASPNGYISCGVLLRDSRFCHVSINTFHDADSECVDLTRGVGVQVERIADRGSLNPRNVKIPGVLVDCIVVAEKPEYHMQTFVEQYNAGFSGEIRVPVSSIAPMKMSERKIIARRAALELKANSVVNLGIGMPEGVAGVATEEKVIDLLTLTAEPGGDGWRQVLEGRLRLRLGRGVGIPIALPVRRRSAQG